VLNFRLLGIPVRIEPFFWASAFFLGRGFHIKNKDDLISTAIWMIILFVSILVHEFGHALTSRKLAGGKPDVALVAFGGYARPNTHLNKKQNILVCFAGPLAGFLLFFITAALVILNWPGEGGMRIAGRLLVLHNS